MYTLNTATKVYILCIEQRLGEIYVGKQEGGLREVEFVVHKVKLE